MADINENQLIEQGTEIPAELKQMMDISLNFNKPDFKIPTEQIASPQEITNNPEGLPPVESQPFSIDIFKEKYGLQTSEDILKEIEEARTLKASPPQPQPITFENEFSEKLFNAIKENKIEEVYSVLDKQLKLDKLTSSEITDENADSIIKLGMQLEYPDLTQSEIDYKFKKTYAYPKEPVQQSDELDDEFQERHNEWKDRVQDINTGKIIDAKVAKPKLQQAKTSISLPDISRPQPDENYLAYQSELDKIVKEDEETKAHYQKATPEQVETRVKFIDEPNNIDFEFVFKPDGESFKKALEVASDSEKFFQRYRNQDGSLDREKYLSDINFIVNKDAIIMEAMKQAKNATIKSSLPDNSGSGLNRMQPEIASGQEGSGSEIDRLMQMALNPYQKRNGVARV